MSVRRPRWTVRGLSGAFVVWAACVEAPTLSQADTADQTVTSEIACDPVAETWSVEVDVSNATEVTEVLLVMAGEHRDETHSVPLRELDPRTHDATYGLTLRITRDAFFDAGSTTRWSCNDSVRTDVFTEN